jgi:hypothetical protein
MKKPKDTCKTSKRERKKKLDKFQDKMHSMFGNKKFSGIGMKKEFYCPKCTTPFEVIMKEDCKWYCRSCNVEVIKKEQQLEFGFKDEK